MGERGTMRRLGLTSIWCFGMTSGCRCVTLLPTVYFVALGMQVCFIFYQTAPKHGHWHLLFSTHRYHIVHPNGPRCYGLITLLIAISNRIPRMSEARLVEGLIPVGAKHTVGILLFMNMLSQYCLHDLIKNLNRQLHSYNFLNCQFLSSLTRD